MYSEIVCVGKSTYSSERAIFRVALRQPVPALFVPPLLYSPLRMMFPENEPVVPPLPMFNVSVPAAETKAP